MYQTLDELTKRCAKTLPAFFLSILLVACSDSGRPLHHVFPPGFTGVFVVIADGEDQGVYTFDGNRHVYKFPDSGIIHIASMRPFEMWHTVSASYDDGTEIPWGETAKLEPQAVRFEQFGATENAHFGAVGTQGQVEDLRRQWGEGELQRLIDQ